MPTNYVSRGSYSVIEVLGAFLYVCAQGPIFSQLNRAETLFFPSLHEKAKSLCHSADWTKQPLQF